MSDSVFCYSCRVHHPRSQMQQWPTRQGIRWRCQRTIQATFSSTVERDQFGKSQTEANKLQAKQMASRKQLLKHQLIGL